MDNLTKIVKELGGVTALVFIFVYIIFYKIFPMLRERDAEIKLAQEKFTELTTKFLDTVHQFNRTLEDFKKEVSYKLEDIKQNTDKFKL